MLTDLVMLSGATGLIGAKVGQLLVQAGFRVVTVSRSAKNASLMCPFPATHIGWDEISKFDLKSVSHVIHLAGEPVANWPWSAKRKKLIVSSRVDATHDFIEHFKTQNTSPKSWTNASAIGFYGDRSETILNETTARGVGFLSDTCDLWEKVTDHPHLSKTRVTKFRIGVVLSNRSGALNQMLPIFRAGLGGRLGSGKQWMSWVDVDDVARMFVFALTNESVSGVFNAVSPTPVTNKEFTKTLASFIGTFNKIPVPAMMMRLAGDFSNIVLGSQRCSSQKIQDAGFKFEYEQLSDSLKRHTIAPVQWGVHELVCDQWIPAKLEQVFPFFSDEMNLERLTPAMLQFKVLGKNTPTIESGTLIDYKLKIRGVPARWQTKILDWNPGKGFVDTQLKGPYKLWHHTHEFSSLGGGTLMTDRVLYKMPVWPFGEAGLPLVKSDVSNIFSYRRKVVAELFPSS